VIKGDVPLQNPTFTKDHEKTARTIALPAPKVERIIKDLGLIVVSMDRIGSTSRYLGVNRWSAGAFELWNAGCQ